jgi:hypothetical protein
MTIDHLLGVLDGSSYERAIPAPRSETLLESMGLGEQSTSDLCIIAMKRYMSPTVRPRPTWEATLAAMRTKCRPGETVWRAPPRLKKAWEADHDDTQYWKNSTRPVSNKREK